MRANTLCLLVMIGALLQSAGSSTAGTLPTDSNALPGWQGTELFTGTAGSFSLVANVEYAVYGPGVFVSSFPAFVDPSGGADYVYAYEILNSNAGNVRVLELSVGLIPGAIPSGSTNIGDLALAGGLVPDQSHFVPLSDPKQSANWDYNSSLLPGLNSDILFFTSPFGPHFQDSTVQGGKGTISQSNPSAVLPSPTPEPASFTLAAIFGACVLALRFARRRSVGR